jgi:DNA repair ATPase RecN
MERKELVVSIKNAFEEVTKTVVYAMNEIRLSMNEKIATIAKAKRELAEDNETLTDISMAVDDFVEDMVAIGVDLEDVTNAVDDILYDLDNIPNELETYLEKKERISEEDNMKDFDEEDED